MLVAINEHADTVCFIAADSGQHAVVVFQDYVSVVAKHRRIAVNCRVARKRLIAGISGLEPAIRLVVFTQGKRPWDTPAASMRIFQRRARLVHDIAHEIGAPWFLGALAKFGAGGLCFEFSFGEADNFLPGRV